MAGQPSTNNATTLGSALGNTDPALKSIHDAAVKLIEKALKKHDLNERGNVGKVADMLGLERQAFEKLRRRYPEYFEY